MGIFPCCDEAVSEFYVFLYFSTSYTDNWCFVLIYNVFRRDFVLSQLGHHELVLPSIWKQVFAVCICVFFSSTRLELNNHKTIILITQTTSISLEFFGTASTSDESSGGKCCEFRKRWLSWLSCLKIWYYIVYESHNKTSSVMAEVSEKRIIFHHFFREFVNLYLMHALPEM